MGFLLAFFPNLVGAITGNPFLAKLIGGGLVVLAVFVFGLYEGDSWATSREKTAAAQKMSAYIADAKRQHAIDTDARSKAEKATEDAKASADSLAAELSAATAMNSILATACPTPESLNAEINKTLRGGLK